VILSPEEWEAVWLDACRGSARGRLWPAAGGADGVGAHSVSVSRTACAQRAAAFANGTATGGIGWLLLIVLGCADRWGRC
jgi:hypothetical protein